MVKQHTEMAASPCSCNANERPIAHALSPPTAPGTKVRRAPLYGSLNSAQDAHQALNEQAVEGIARTAFHA
jgi:hypothetical protein